MTKIISPKIAAVLASLLFLFISSATLADTSGTYDFATQSGLNTTATQAGYSDALKALSPSNLTSRAISIILSIIGLIFIGLMIYGGITWMTAEGNEQKVEKAKQVIIGSIVGLIIVLAAYAASNFIISYFSKQTFS